MNVLSGLPIESGHFLLESGYHSNLWVKLDALFVDPAKVAPLISVLAEKLHRYDVTAVCGPMVGGAFVAAALARELGKRFYFTSRSAASDHTLLSAEYVIPPELHPMIKGERVALVDDAISAGSSVRATQSALDRAGAVTAVVAAFIVFGNAGRDYFNGHGISVEAIEHREFTMWKPAECPLCLRGEPLRRP